jgi:hypothetical protein
MGRSWGEIKRSYEDCADSSSELRGMLQLVEDIEASPYAQGIWGWTSIYDLCVAQMPITDPLGAGPYLRISPGRDGNIEFRYLDTAIKNRQWHRVVPAAEAFQRLERLFHQLNWFGRRSDAVGERS